MMSDAVTVEMPLELMREIEKSLEECSQDLEAEVSERYPEAQRNQYPSYARRWGNDMEPVRQAQKMVQAIRSQQWWSGGVYNSTGDQGDG